MPYIKQENRDFMDIIFKEFSMQYYHHKMNEGDLNYLVTKIINYWLDQEGRNYRNLNAVMGILECIKQEFYRRIAAPYEDQKKKDNGDVYQVYPLENK